RFFSWQARALTSWAHALNVQAEHQAALEKYTQAHRLIEKVQGPNSLDAAVALTNLGSTLRLMQRPQQAIEQHRKALKILLRQDPEPVRHLVSTHRNLAGLLLDRGDLEGLKHYDLALGFARKISDPRDRSATVATLLNNLGYAHHRLRQLDKARHYYEE